MTRIGRILLALVFVSGGLFYFGGCDTNTSSQIEESLKAVPKVTPIEGAQEANLIINDGEKSYFEIDFSNIIPNEYIDNSTREGWCIAYDTPISSQGATYGGLKISVAEGEDWQPIRRLLGIKNQLLAENPDITYREVQVAIWTLRDFPEFDLEKVTAENAPRGMAANGRLNFSKEEVRNIVNRVTSSSLQKSKSLTEEDPEICVVETDGDTQTVIVPCGDTFWAYGEISFRQVFGNGQWGWIYVFRPDDENPSSTPLIAGGGQDDGTLSAEDLMDHWVGELNVSLDGDELSVTYSADGDNQFSIAHLWVGCDYETELPVTNKDNVPPGQLPFSYEADEGEFFTDHTFTLTIGSENDHENLQIAQCPDDEYQIAAHGVVGDD